MGPRLVSRGKFASAFRADQQDGMLQWGRDLLVAESGEK